tara:strand:+ start:392 stop:859 length:468 start_codon:yes stop_codon:yes gene_type:complete
MTEDVTKSPKTPSEKDSKKKNVFAKIKDGIDDKEEQLVILSTFVRLGVVVWSGFIISLNYITLPAFGQQAPKDITFVASVFTGALASFGLQTASKKGDGTMKMDNKKGGGLGEISREDFERLIEKMSQVGPTQTLRIEQAPIKITTVDNKTSLDS